MSKRPWHHQPEICQVHGCGKAALCHKKCRRHYDASIQSKKSSKFRPEYHIAAVHIRNIRIGYSTYKDMPIFAAWDTKRGGSPAAAEKWICHNIGRRPKDGIKYQLHIVDRTLGFVPNNLRWVPADKHKREELVTRLLLENQNLRAELQRVSATLY